MLSSIQLSQLLWLLILGSIEHGYLMLGSGKLLIYNMGESSWNGVEVGMGMVGRWTWIDRE